jgi:transcriptional regulator with XRE-family HTH domain
MVTQTEIAHRLHLDVSTVNKILHSGSGPVFRKETIRKVFRTARALGYDFDRLKHRHRRRHPRQAVDLPVAISIYTEDFLYDRGQAVLRNISLSGALLGKPVLPGNRLPAKSPIVGIRAAGGPLPGVEILGRVTRLACPNGEDLDLAIKFLEGQEPKIRRWLARGA